MSVKRFQKEFPSSGGCDDPLTVRKAYHQPKTEYRIISDRYDRLLSLRRKNKGRLVSRFIRRKHEQFTLSPRALTLVFPKLVSCCHKTTEPDHCRRKPCEHSQGSLLAEKPGFDRPVSKTQAVSLFFFALLFFPNRLIRRRTMTTASMTAMIPKTPIPLHSVSQNEGEYSFSS